MTGTVHVSEDTDLRGGELLAAISRGIVQLLREHAGKGPTKCRTSWAGPNALLVLLDEGFTAAERTLRDAGHREQVVAGRASLNEVLDGPMRDLVERLTGRQVRALMCAVNDQPEILAEIFVLEPLPAAEDGAGNGSRLVTRD